MTLHSYNKKILKFLYELSKQQKIMSSIEIASYLNEKDHNITDRTIRRWLNFVKDAPRQCTDYWVEPNFQNLNLIPTYAIFEDLKEEFLDILPNIFYVFSGHDQFTSLYLVGYLVPKEEYEEFHNFLDESRSEGAFSRYELIPVKNSFIIYSPFHKIVDKRGNINFKEEIDNSHFIEIMESRFNEEQETKMHKEVKHNPLIISVIMEGFRENWSAEEIWFSMKKKLGDKVWDYVRDIKHRNRRTDNAGIKAIQDTKKILNDELDELYGQTRIYYQPFFSKRNHVSYFVLKMRNTKKLVDLSEEVSKNCLETVLYPHNNFRENKRVLLFVQTNHNKHIRIVSDILPKYIDKSKRNRIIHLNHYKQKNLNTRSHMKPRYTEIFDPVNTKWNLKFSNYKKAVSLI